MVLTAFDTRGKHSSGVMPNRFDALQGAHLVNLGLDMYGIDFRTFLHWINESSSISHCSAHLWPLFLAMPGWVPDMDKLIMNLITLGAPKVTGRNPWK